MLLYDRLALGVEGTGGLVEHENRGDMDECSRNCQPLALTAGKVSAALLEDGRIAVWQALNEFVRTRDLRYLDHFLEGGSRLRHRDVLAHGPAKKEILLKYHANSSAQMRKI